MSNLLRAFITIVVLAAPGFAQAHPHVWVTFTSELLFAPDGTLTGVRHHWAFDDMFSAFATQGIESKVKGQFTREELAPLAEVNVTSLKEYDYFTFVNADGKKVELTDPVKGEYYLEYKDSVLTLNFTLPLKQPVKAHQYTVDVYDPTIFVDFEFAKGDPVKLDGVPKDCKGQIILPRELTFAESKALAQIPADQTNTMLTFGEAMANKIRVSCP